MSTVVVLILFLVTFKGADLAIKTQYYILAVLLLSVAAFVVGGVASFDSARLADNMTPRPGGGAFWILFAIFFPAATGITAGANMSGDLKDPARSIPNGTLLAVGFTAAIYLIQLVLLAGFIDRGAMEGLDQAGLEQLGAHNLRAMAGVLPLIVAGVFAATLSSALGSLLGAPRILQAMGKDRLVKVLVPFGRGRDLRARGVVAFADSVVVDDGPRRLDAVIQAYSIGSLRPNTVMISVPPPSQVERRAHVAATLRVVAGFDLNVVLYKGARADGMGRRRIDVWWHG